MIDAKAEIAKAIEQARKEKVIGHSLDARITIAAPDKIRALFETHLEDLRALLIVSQLQLADVQNIANPYQSEEIKGLAVGVEKARGTKCERCWIYEESVGMNAEHPTVCGRCIPNL
jgi:isoleucyl-tRNA synthetase